MHTEIILSIKNPYIFTSTLRSHGWVHLLPNVPDEKVESFSRVERLSSGRVICIHAASLRSEFPKIIVTITHEGVLLQIERDEIIKRVRYMLRLDEDLQDFYALCKKKGRKGKNFKEGRGYLLRSPEIFEDLVKVICTTNIQWGGTKRMVKELVNSFGVPFPGDPSLRSFPSPESIASGSLEEFKGCVRLGYRAGYVYELSARITSGGLDLKSFLDISIPAAEVKKRLIAIKGVGNYAAASMLMLLGRYDQIPVDTVFRNFMKANYFKNKQFSEEEGLNIYEEWGQWKYLAYWNDLLAFYNPKAEIE